MRRHGVLIVSASTGTGHTRAGEALREAIADRDPELPVQHVDLLSIAPSWVRATYSGGYELMATRAPWLWHRVYQQTDGDGWDRARWSSLARRLLFREFQKLLRASPWELCLCTHFLPCQLAAGKPGLPPFALAITDFTLHRYWVQPGVQQYFVATETLANDLRSRAPRARIDATGIPIASAFTAAPSRTAARAALGMAVRQPVVLVMGGGLGLGVVEMAEATLAGAPADVLVVAICGRNSAAAAQLRGLDLPASRLRVEGYVSQIADFISSADLVVTKPGGLTVSESIALGKPLLLTRPIPGQETGNTRALVGAGAALAAQSDRDIREGIERLMTDEGLLFGLASSARRIGRPYSASSVAASIVTRQQERIAFASSYPTNEVRLHSLPRAG